ncbi:ABC transporter ATP-binding protein [Paracoccaceae bacterium GXU_MW_L88]
MAPKRKGFLIVGVVMVLAAIGSAFYAKFIEWIIAAFEERSDSVIWWGPLGVIALTSFNGVFGYLQTTRTNKLLAGIQVDMQEKLFDTLVTADLARLQSEPPAALATRFSTDIDLIRTAMRRGFEAIRALLVLISTFIVMLTIDWSLTLALIFIFGLAVFPVNKIGARVRVISRETQADIASMAANINEGLSGIRMVRTYQLEDHLRREANGLFARLYKLRVKLVEWQARTSPLMEILVGIAIGVLLLLVSWRLNRETITLAQFMGLLTGLGVAASPARQLGQAYATALQGQAALERVFDLYDAPNHIRSGDQRVENTEGAIRFEDVGFTYPGGGEALKDFDLSIDAGQKVAFVGRSGAGKSTVFNLLPRLFDASEGRVLLDGRDITTLDLGDLRRQISVVSQDSVLLTGTVAENIGFGRPEASREAIITAAKDAAAHDFIEKLPQGYDTPITGAHQFSGGERQRLSIARAMLRDAPILLLDEPTSALDAQSEAAIREALDRLAKGRTTLVIAHRLATILDADLIVVMEAGRIVETGTHAALLENDGAYAELYNLQFSGAEPMSVS